MIHANEPILKNVVSPRWSKTLCQNGVPHYCRNYWLWNPQSKVATLTGYYFDMDRNIEQADMNMLFLHPHIEKFPAYTTNEIEPLIGDYKLKCLNGLYTIITVPASVTDERLADAYAHIVLQMLDKGVMCPRTFKSIQSG